MKNVWKSLGTLALVAVVSAGTTVAVMQYGNKLLTFNSHSSTINDQQPATAGR